MAKKTPKDTRKLYKIKGDEPLKIRTEHTAPGDWKHPGETVKLEKKDAQRYRKYLDPDPGAPPKADPDPRRPEREERRKVRLAARKAAAEEFKQHRQAEVERLNKEAAAEKEGADAEEPADEESPEQEPKQCTATTKSGSQCKNPAVEGSEFCAVHEEAPKEG